MFIFAIASEKETAMAEKKPTYTEGIGWRYETEHSMTRRMQDHDYQSRPLHLGRREGDSTCRSGCQAAADSDTGEWLPTALQAARQVFWSLRRRPAADACPLALPHGETHHNAPAMPRPQRHGGCHQQRAMDARAGAGDDLRAMQLRVTFSLLPRFFPKKSFAVSSVFCIFAPYL